MSTICMLQTEDQIKVVRLDGVVKNALEYYVKYMDRILEVQVLPEVDPRTCANAKRSRDTAKRFLGHYKEGRAISVTDGAEDIKQYITMLSIYGEYLGSINDAMEPSLREQRIVDQGIEDEYKKAIEKMYEFYSLLTQIDQTRSDR